MITLKNNKYVNPAYVSSAEITGAVISIYVAGVKFGEMEDLPENRDLLGIARQKPVKSPEVPDPSPRKCGCWERRPVYVWQEKNETEE